VAGQMLAVCLVHGGPSPRFLSPTLFDALVKGPEHISVPFDDITNEEVRNTIKKVNVYLFNLHNFFVLCAIVVTISITIVKFYHCCQG
jgi:hypothetical protein